LIWQLTGGAAHVTDPTNASRTLLYNIHDRKWDPVLLEAMDIPRAMLPEVRPGAGRFGETRVEAPVSGMSISGVAGDQQAALYGQGCWDPGMAKNTSGTGAFVVATLGQQPARIARRPIDDHRVRPDRTAGPHPIAETETEAGEAHRLLLPPVSLRALSYR